MAFDPQIATAAYMAQLSVAQHAKATAYTQGGHWVLLWSWLAGVVAAWLILRTGVLARIGNRIEKRASHPWIAAFVLAAIFTLLSWILTLPWSLYAGWWREKFYGLNNQTWPAWLHDQAVEALIGALTLGIFYMLLYALIRYAPKRWWAWAAGLAALGFAFSFLIAPVLVEPLFNKFTPAPAGPIRTAIVQLAEENGVPSDKIYIYNGSKQSDRYTANVSGMFGSARIAMSDVMFRKGADISEVRGVVGHEMGHYVHNHGIWLTLYSGLRALIGLGLVAWLFPYAARWLGAGTTLGITDPRTLPVFVILTATLTLLATPISNATIRAVESDADAFSLEHAHEPDGLSEALVKTIDYRASSPSALEEFVFYDHPSVERRVHRAMNWKAAHMAETQATAKADAALEALQEKQRASP